ncbi:MAG: nicotinate-nucleotide adenylyltransferase [Acidobacteriota bacterium]
MSRRERLGILGGTFDPIHLGHLRAAESVREAMALDRVLFVPARVPPHKARPSIAAAEHRFRMVEAAVRTEPAFEVSRLELEREGASYTIETLAELAQSRPDTELFFITGIDAFRDIRTWKCWEELLRSYSFIVHGRPGYGLAGVGEVIPSSVRKRLVELRNNALPPLKGSTPADEAPTPAIYLVDVLTINVSGTEIRAMVRANRSIRFLVPAEVEVYIMKHRLYREGP